MIRKATLQDIEAIVALIQPQSEASILLPRTAEDVEGHLREFFVYEQEGRLVGTASLVTGYSKMVEIRSLVVDPGMRGNGIGQALVQACIDEAIEMGYESIFVLTYVVPVFKNWAFRSLINPNYQIKYGETVRVAKNRITAMKLPCAAIWCVSRSMDCLRLWPPGTVIRSYKSRPPVKDPRRSP